MAKLLSELPVGALVKDTSTTYNGEPIIWRVLEHGHDGDPNGSTTLEAKDIISLKCFDAREPSNSNIDRQNYGNNRYAYSNLLQWLNSDWNGVVGETWWTPQHDYDTPPSETYVLQETNYSTGGKIGINPYDTELGFLTNFSPKLKAGLQTVSKETALDGNNTELVDSKIFLLSSTEIGLAIPESSVIEGSIYEYYNLDNTNSRRLKTLTQGALTQANYSYPSEVQNWNWWLRSPDTRGYFLGAYTAEVAQAGYWDSQGCYYSFFGVSPALCVPSSFTVLNEPVNGVYVLDWSVDPNKKITFSFLKEVVNVLQAPATADTYDYVQASGAYVEGTTYYTDNTGATEVDTTGFDENTDVSSYYVRKLIQGTSGRLTSSDKDKLDKLSIATDEEFTNALNNLDNL